jgi:N-acetylglutamate synthase-like GNAT family acetyltransferase
VRAAVPPRLQGAALVLLTVVVRADQRRSGAGDQLLARLLQTAAETAAASIVADVSVSNAAALAFFGSRGFEGGARDGGTRAFQRRLQVQACSRPSAPAAGRAAAVACQPQQQRHHSQQRPGAARVGRAARCAARRGTDPRSQATRRMTCL